jgi:hypothetical protein
MSKCTIDLISIFLLQGRLGTRNHKQIALTQYGETYSLKHILCSMGENVAIFRGVTIPFESALLIYKKIRKM